MVHYLGALIEGTGLGKLPEGLVKGVSAYYKLVLLSVLTHEQTRKGKEAAIKALEM